MEKALRWIEEGENIIYTANILLNQRNIEKIAKEALICATKIKEFAKSLMQ